MPALLAVSASEGINILTSTPSVLATLHDNIRVIRSTLEKVDQIEIASHPASAVIHIHLRTSTYSTSGNGLLLPTTPTKANVVSSGKLSNPSSLQPRDYVVSDWATEERVLQDVVDEALLQGVLLTRAKRLRGQESLEPRASIKIVATAALSKKDTEKAANVIKAAIIKVVGRRR